jgi:hypothetical protein
MRVGEVVNAKAITVVYFGVSTLRRLEETWRTRKGYTYVVAVLAVEEDGKTINLDQTMKEMGWVRSKNGGHLPKDTRKFDTCVGRTL